MNTTQVIQLLLGRLPVYCGDWDPHYNNDQGYYKYNEVTYAGSSFISRTDGNRNTPCTMVHDSSGGLLEYSVGDGWKIQTNGLDSSVQCSAAIKNCREEVIRCEQARQQFSQDISQMQQDITQLQADSSTMANDIHLIKEYLEKVPYAVYINDPMLMHMQGFNQDINSD